MPHKAIYKTNEGISFKLFCFLIYVHFIRFSVAESFKRPHSSVQRGTEGQPCAVGKDALTQLRQRVAYRKASSLPSRTNY